VFVALGALGVSRHGQRDERFEHGARIDASARMSGIVLKNDSSTTCSSLSRRRASTTPWRAC
jgi:hypothetical protein